MEITCEECGVVFETGPVYWKRFCSTRCRNRNWNRRRTEGWQEWRQQQGKNRLSRERERAEERREK